jgi:hypothetical protein
MDMADSNKQREQAMKDDDDPAVSTNMNELAKVM